MCVCIYATEVLERVYNMFVEGSVPCLHHQKIRPSSQKNHLDLLQARSSQGPFLSAPYSFKKTVYK